MENTAVNNVNITNSGEEDEIDLLLLFSELLRKWYLIVIVSILGAAIALGYTAYFVTPMYESDYMLYVLTKSTSVTSLADLQIGSQISEDFSVIAKSKPVVDSAVARIKSEYGKELKRDDITNMITINKAKGDRILVIEVVNADPELAAIIANAMGEETAAQMASIMKTDPPTTVERAEVAKYPVSPSLKKNTVLGFAVGFVLICAIICISVISDNTVKTEEDVERYLGSPVLAAIPLGKEIKNVKKQQQQQTKKQEE